MDLDDFKSINDTEGHPAGDLILKKFGEAVLGEFRESDISGRYGGDEAIVMLTGFKKRNTKREELKIQRNLTEKIGVGVSVGIAVWDGHGSLEELIIEADKRLYVNKNK